MTFSNNGESVSFQVYQSNQLYPLLLEFIPKHLKEESAKTFSPKILPNQNDGDDSDDDDHEDHDDIANLEPSKVVGVVLGMGEYQFVFKGIPYRAIHKEVGVPVSSFRGDPVTRRDLTIEAQSLEQLQALTADVYLSSIAKAKKGTFKIFRWNASCEYWSREKTVMARSIESVIMDPESKSKLMTDLDDFLGQEAKQFYQHHGIPYRRSYLLYGQPGSGKTSLIQALAGHYGRSVCFLQPTNPKMTDDTFKSALNELPHKAIVVLEDIDSLFLKNRTTSNNHTSHSSLTFSGLLNGLDGVGSAEGRLVFMTTNYRNRLDSALVRPGRVDLHVNFPFATQYQMEEYFRQYYPTAMEEVAVEFGKRLMDDLSNANMNIATASLQHFFVTHRKLNAMEALNAVHDIVKEVKLRRDEEEHIRTMDEEQKKEAKDGKSDDEKDEEKKSEE